MTLANPVGIDGREPVGKMEATRGKKDPRIIVNQEIKQLWGEGCRARSRKKPVDKRGRSWESQNKKPTSFREEPMRMTKMERSCGHCCHRGKMGRNQSKHQTLIKKGLDQTPSDKSSKGNKPCKWKENGQLGNSFDSIL